ncbi:MAG: hypothetical protein ACI4E2_07390 [Acetatifactor sp.]
MEMSKKEQQTQEKVMTKYDRKMQRREEEKRRAKKEKVTGTVALIAILVALVCFVLSFPIRTYMTLNKTFVTVGDEKLTKVEYDYYFYTTMNDYINQYGMYLSYMGLDVNGDISAQMYSETMTWKDYFDEMTVEAIKQSKSLKKDAEANGFTADVQKDYDTFIQNQKDAASEMGLSYSEYIKKAFGPYATEKRITPFVKEAAMVSQYYDKVEAEKKPTDEDMEKYYAENTQSYDSVNYRLFTIDAELPTAPTELADPVEEAEENTENGEEKEYEPSEAEIQKAMEDAKAVAESKLETVAEEGERTEGARYSTLVTVLQDWLFEDGRKAGDKEIIEDSSYNRYYVIWFEARYRDETPTRNVRGIMTTNEKAQEFVDQWKENGSTEGAFVELCNNAYKEYSLSADGGLVEGIAKKGLDEGLANFLFADDTKPGAVEIIPAGADDTVNSYVLYYIGENRPEWKLSIENTLTNQNMTDYVNELTKDVVVTAPKGNLPFIRIREEEAKASEEAAQSEDAENSSEEE